MTTDQPPPQPSSGDVWRLVIADMEERRRVGIERYGVPLQPLNGRDALVDAYQEALDMAVYLRQAIEEREVLRAQIKGHVERISAQSELLSRKAER